MIFQRRAATAFRFLIVAASAAICTVCPAQDGQNAALPPLAWRSPAWAGSAPIVALSGTASNGFQIKLAPGRPWSAAVASLPVNVDATPVLAVSVANVSPGAGWIIKLDDAPYAPVHPREIVTTPAGGESPGKYLVDLREISGGAWRGRKQIDVRLFVTGPPSGAAVTFSQIALLPGVKKDKMDKSPARASTADSFEAAAPQIASGTWTARYVPATRRILLSRADTFIGSGATGEVSIFLPGITNGIGPVAVEAEKDRNHSSKRPAITAFILRMKNAAAEYEARASAYPPRNVGNGGSSSGKAALLRWTVTAHLRAPLPATALRSLMPATGAECSYEPTTASGAGASDLPVRVLSVHRFGQLGQETGQAFLPCDPVLGTTALYVQNLTAIAPFFDATHTTGTKSVSATPEGFGFSPVPAAGQASGADTQLPAGIVLTLADSFLALAENNDGSGDAAAVPSSPLSQSRDYLDLLATVYDALPDRPATIETNWAALAERSLSDLASPACWSGPASGYLRSYVNEPWGDTTGELTVQLAPLVASLLYERARNLTPTLLTWRITPTLRDFYSPETRSVHDFTTVPHPDRADSGTQVGCLLLLAQAAELGSPQAKSLLRDSLDATIALARRHQYRFPVFFDPKYLNAIGGVEPDCAGVYAYLMLASYRLFGDPTYLDEAKKSLATIDAFGMEYAYEMHGTAIGAVACAQLWKLTGDRAYLDKSLLPLANVLRHCWLYEPDYGFRKNEHHFFTASAMPGVYAAPAEQYQTWLALREYDDITHDTLPRSARLLVGEFLKYGQTNLRYLYPAYLTPGSVAIASDRGGKLEPNLLVPIEDLNDAWLISGRIGQEVYGAGGPLALAAKTISTISEAGITVSSEYPIREFVWNAKRHILRLNIAGVGPIPIRGANETTPLLGRYTTRITIRYDAVKTGWKRLRVQIVGGNGKVTARRDTLGTQLLEVAGENTLLIDAEPTPQASETKPNKRSL